MKTYYSDNLKPAPIGMSNAILQVTKQLVWTHIKLNSHEAELEARQKKEAADRELKARVDRLRYQYEGLKR